MFDWIDELHCSLFVTLGNVACVKPRSRYFPYPLFFRETVSINNSRFVRSLTRLFVALSYEELLTYQVGGVILMGGLSVFFRDCSLNTRRGWVIDCGWSEELVRDMVSCFLSDFCAVSNGILVAFSVP